MASNSSYSGFGYLELIVGPMFSGKTSKLLEIYKQCKFCSIPVSIINHEIDNRYHDSMLSSHDKIMAPCIKTIKLKDIWPSTEELKNADVILINEGQFFPDLYETVTEMVSSGKKVYVSGLDGDFKLKRFGEILDLVPFCDKITKLTSLCSKCKNGTPGIFSMRLTQEKEQTVVGSDNYIPVCRKCYSDLHII